MRTAECIVIFRGRAAGRPAPVNKRVTLWEFFIKRNDGLQSPLFSCLCIRRESKFKSNFSGKCPRNCTPFQRTDGIVTTSSTPRHLANLCLYFKCAISSGGGWVSKLKSFFLPHLGFGHTILHQLICIRTWKLYSHSFWRRYTSWHDKNTQTLL